MKRWTVETRKKVYPLAPCSSLMSICPSVSIPFPSLTHPSYPLRVCVWGLPASGTPIWTTSPTSAPPACCPPRPLPKISLGASFSLLFRLSHRLPEIPQASCKATHGTLCHCLDWDLMGSTERGPAGPEPERGQDGVRSTLQWGGGPRPAVSCKPAGTRQTSVEANTLSVSHGGRGRNGTN